MKNIPVVKLGIVGVSRDCFPASLTKTRREALVKAYTEKYGADDIYECPVTIIESEIDMVNALEDIKKAGCNALCVFLGNFGPEISETLLAKHFDGPKMFVAAAEENNAEKEYVIDISKEKIEEIDNNQTSYIIYENNNKKELSKSDFFMKNQYFDNYIVFNKKVTKEEDLREERNYYYFVENNKVYKLMKKSNRPILLFELNDINDWYVSCGEVLVISNGILYSFTDKNGLRKIAESNELKYNFKNIYKKWEK